MQIDENEARIVVAAIKCSDFEQGEDPVGGSAELVSRIRKEFPNIDRGIIETEQKLHIWSVLAEQDPRVIAARGKVDTTSYVDLDRDNVVDELLRIKFEVSKELLAKSGLE